MKKIISIVILSLLCLCAFAQDTRIQPGGVPTPVPIFDITQLEIAISNITSGLINSNVTIINSNFTIINNFISNYFITDGSLSDGFIMQPAYNFPGSNGLWWDWGQTNAGGFHLLYASYIATNPIVFLGPTNMVRWRPFSYDIITSGTNAPLYFPTNIPYLATNGMVLTGSYYKLILTNGNLLRMTLQSNLALEPIWITHGQ